MKYLGVILETGGAREKMTEDDKAFTLTAENHGHTQAVVIEIDGVEVSDDEYQYCDIPPPKKEWYLEDKLGEQGMKDYWKASEQIEKTIKKLYADNV